MSRNKPQKSNNPPTSTRYSAVYQQEVWQAPLPRPDILSQYNEIIPNGAERILLMAENQSQHRIAAEKKVIESAVKRANRGQFFGFIISITALLISGYGLYLGFEIAAAIIGGGGLTALVSLFILGTSSQKKEIKRKDPLNQ